MYILRNKMTVYDNPVFFRRGCAIVNSEFGKIWRVKCVQIVNMHEKEDLSEYSDKYLQKQALETA